VSCWWVVRNASTGKTSVVSGTCNSTFTSSAGDVIGGPYTSKAAAQSGGANSPGATVTQSGGCGPQAVYTALLAAGFSTVQAVGAMANAIAESTLNPEARAVDSNGYYSDGLWQFNEETYPDASSLVTGNCASDITNQVGYLKAHVSGQALAGSTGAEVAGNFASNFERCQGCQQGSTAANGWSTRVANASTVQGWLTSGNWPTSSAGISGSGGGSGGTVTTSYAAGTCAVPLTLPLVGSVCVISKSQARGVIGALLIGAGAVPAVVGLLILLAAGLGGTGVGRAAGQAVAAGTPAGRLLRPLNVSNDRSQPPVLPAT